MKFQASHIDEGFYVKLEGKENVVPINKDNQCPVGEYVNIHKD